MTSLTFKSRIKTVTAIAVTAALAGCGGGGGGGTTSSTAASPTAAITTSNATQIASTAFNGTSGLSQLSGSTTALKSTATGQPVNVLSIVSSTITNELQERVYTPPQSPLARAAASVTNTQQCSGGGSLTAIVNKAGTAWQPGDSLSITANSCQDSTNGITLNGTLILVIDSITQNDSSGFSASVSLGATNFTATQGSNYASLNGTFQVSVALQSTNYAVATSEVELKSSGFTLSSNTVGTISLENLDYVDYNNIAQGSWWFTQNSTVNNNGSVFMVQTSQPFAAAGCSYPSIGSALLTGLNSSELVTANSNGTTTLQVTSNGTTTLQTVPSSQVFSVVCN